MNATGTKFIATLLIAVAFASCKRETPYNPATSSEEIPNLPITPDNFPESDNDHLATLGKVLFYDKQLSLNNNVACASCHIQERAFTDNLRTSPGTDGLHGKRNTPVLFPKAGRMFWDGRSNDLNDMVLRPIQDPLEMNQSITSVLNKIKNLDYYQHLFKLAFPNAAQPDSSHLRLALAEFINNFSFSQTRFAKSERGVETLTPDENTGKDLFFGEAQCSNCHHIRAFPNPDGGNNGYGRTDEAHNIGLDAITTDKGVGGVSGESFQDGSFMMPVLLNVQYTAPYMHDGRFNTLEEVVEHYNSGIKNHPNLSPILRTGFSGEPLRLNLNDHQKKCLVAFLKTLSDPSILTDKKYANPFIQRVN